MICPSAQLELKGQSGGFRTRETRRGKPGQGPAEDCGTQRESQRKFANIMISTAPVTLRFAAETLQSLFAHCLVHQCNTELLNTLADLPVFVGMQGGVIATVQIWRLVLV